MLAGGLPDVLVLRSLTKTWSLAGLRIGYLFGDPGVLARLSSHRPHWPLGTLQLEAIAACCEPDAVAAAEAEAERLAVTRSAMVAALKELGLDVVEGSAPFVLFCVPDGHLVRKHLITRGIAVRRCDTFVGLGRESSACLGAARMAGPGRRDRGGPSVSVVLRDVIGVLTTPTRRTCPQLGFRRAGLWRPR